MFEIVRYGDGQNAHPNPQEGAQRTFDVIDLGDMCVVDSACDLAASWIFCPTGSSVVSIGVTRRVRSNSAACLGLGADHALSWPAIGDNGVNGHSGGSRRGIAVAHHDSTRECSRYVSISRLELGKAPRITFADWWTSGRGTVRALTEPEGAQGISSAVQISFGQYTRCCTQSR